MSYTVTEESLTNLHSYWSDSKHNLNWNPIFVSPGWLQTWWQIFGSDNKLFILAVRQNEAVIGIAPLLINEISVSFIGSANVSDYLDFIITPGKEKDFFNTLLDYLKEKGLSHLDLDPVRQDSKVLTHLAGIAENRGYEVLSTSEDVSLEMELPSTWDEYLELLTTKQRHEVRRKLRRLSESGSVGFHIVDDSDDVSGAMDIFLKMFSESRQDKADFLTTTMESFFRLLADIMAGAGLLKIGILEMDKLPAASVMCFDYDNCVYLYNSGYNLAYNYAGVGLMSKVLAIKDSIRRGKTRFDFLKGAESYKYHLGGREVPIYRCRINIR